MKAPNVNFVGRSPRTISPRLLGLLLVVGALFALDLWQTRRAGAELAEQSLDAYAEAALSAAEAASASMRKAAESRDLAATTSIKHAQVLRAVESLRLPGVRLSSLVIDPEESLARIEIELAAFDQVSECLELLNNASSSLTWRATTVQSGDGQRPTTLTVEARVKPGCRPLQESPALGADRVRTCSSRSP